MTEHEGWRNQLSIPGWDEIIHIKPEWMQDEEEVKARKRRQYLAILMSPSPGIVQRANQYITMLDDAEDLLSTAMVLGKPLLRRLPARLVPGVGWVLLGNDMIDFAVWVLSISSTGLLQKRNVGEQLKSLSFRRGNRMRKSIEFFQRKAGFGALLEGLQVADNFFGIGLCLGPIMGLASDTIWGFLRAAGGQRVKIRVPTPERIEEKAAKVAWSSPFLMMLPREFTKDLIYLTYAGVQLALDTLKATSNLITQVNKFGLVQNEPTPQFIPNKELTREVIREAGIDPDRDEPPVTASLDPAHIPIVDWMWENSSQGHTVAEDMDMLFGPTLEGEFMTMGGLEMSDITNSWIGEEDSETIWHPNGSDMVLKTMVEYGYAFWPGMPRWRITKIMHEIHRMGIWRMRGDLRPYDDVWGTLYMYNGLEHTPKPRIHEIEHVLNKFGATNHGMPRLPPHEPPQPWWGRSDAEDPPQGFWKEFLEKDQPT